MDPFNRTVSVLAFVGFVDSIVPLTASVVVKLEDKLDIFRTVEDAAVLVGARADLNEKDVYVFVVDFKDSDWVPVLKVFSSNDPGDEIKLALEVNDAASPLMDTGSVLAGEDSRLDETGIWFWDC